MKARCHLHGLAMPGLDGWGHLRPPFAPGSDRRPVAIVSANALEKGAENTVAWADDFMVKPVRVATVARLGWTATAAGVGLRCAAPMWPTRTMPSAAALRHLDRQIQSGYVRGDTGCWIRSRTQNPIATALFCACATWPDNFNWTPWRWHSRCMPHQASNQDLATWPHARSSRSSNRCGFDCRRRARQPVVLHDALDEAGYTVLVATHGETPPCSGPAKRCPTSSCWMR